MIWLTRTDGFNVLKSQETIIQHVQTNKRKPWINCDIDFEPRKMFNNRLHLFTVKKRYTIGDFKSHKMCRYPGGCLKFKYYFIGL